MRATQLARILVNLLPRFGRTSLSDGNATLIFEGSRPATQCAAEDKNISMPTDPKFFPYLRVSTSDQNIESQRFALLEYCARQGLTNYEMFIDHA